MALESRLLSAEWQRAVREFNGRLNAAGIAAGLRLPVEPHDPVLLPGSQVHLVIEGGAVRGGFILRPQSFFFSGVERRVTHYRLPLSEGLIDRRYAVLGPWMLRRALQIDPLLYALGMGGYDRPLPRMLAAMGWRLSSIPFYFRIVHGGSVLRGLRAVRQNPWRAALFNLAAWTGLGGTGLAAWQRFRTRRPLSEVAAKPVDDFNVWADEIWETSHRAYELTALRDAHTLRQLYPPGAARFLKLRVNSAGWAVMLDTSMRDDPYFGDLRVGTIVDSMAKPENAAAVIHAARRYLEQRGVDLIISNQAHPAWAAALKGDGFFEGPSNFLLGASKAFSEALGPKAELHLNRGDGDGPVNL